MVSGRDERTLMKLVVDMKTDKVLGVHILGARRGRDRADGGGRAQARRHQGTTSTRPWRCIQAAAEELVTLRHKWEAPAPVAGSDAAA